MNTEPSHAKEPAATPSVSGSPVSRRKWLVIGLIIALIVFGGIVGVALLNLGSLIESNQELIFTQIERALGRKVEAKDLKVQIWGGIGFRLTGVSIADDPALSSKNMIEADDLSFDVKFWPLLKKELRIEELVVHRPVVNIIRTKDGQLNITALGASQPAPSEPSKAPAPSESAPTTEPTAKPPKPEEKPSETASGLEVSTLQIEDGVLIYHDPETNEEYQLKELDLQIEDFGMDRSMTVQFASAVFAERPNVKISGKLGPIGAKPDFSQLLFDLQTELIDFPLDRLEKSIPDLKNQLHVPPEFEVSGAISLNARVQGPVSKIAVKGQINADKTHITLHKRFDKPADVGTTLETDASYENGKVLVREARLQLQTLALAPPEGVVSGVYQLQNVDLSIKDYGSDRASTVNFDAAVFAQRPNIHISGNVGPIGPQFDWQQIPVDVKTTLDEFPLDRIAAIVPDWKEKIGIPKELQISGPLTLDTAIKGTVNALSVDGQVNADRMELAYGKRFTKPADTPFNVNANVQYEHGALKVDRARIKLHTLELDAAGELKRGAEDQYAIDYRLAKMNLNGWERLVPEIESYRMAGSITSEGKITGELKSKELPQFTGSLNVENVRAEIPQLPKPIADANAAITFEGHKVTTRNMRWTIGQSQMTLTLDANTLWPLDGDIEFSAPEIHLADLMERNQPNARPEIIRQFQIAGQAKGVNGDTNFQGKLTSTDGTLAEIDYKQLDADISLVGKSLTVPQLTVQTFGGDIESAATYSWKTESPQFTLKTTVKNIDMDTVARASDPQAKPKFHGRLDSNINLNGRGSNAAEIRSTLAGDVQVEIHDGTYEGVNFVRSILTPLTKVPGIQSIFSPMLGSKVVGFLDAPDTVFQEMKGTATIANEKVNIDTLKIAASDWSIQGKGTVDFDKKVDAEGVLSIAPRYLSSLANSIKELKPLTESDEPRGIPFLLKGTLPNVTPLPDPKGLVKSFPKMLLDTAGGVGGSAKNILESVGGLLPGVGGEKAANETSEATKETATKEESAAKKLEEGLKGLFGGKK